MTEWHTEAQLLREVAARRKMSEIRHLIHFWTIELASLDQTNYLTNLREGRAYFGGLREGLRMGWEGSPTAVGTTAMKAPERGGLTTRNHLIYDEFIMTFSHNVTNVLHLWRFPVFRHGCAWVDIKAQNIVTFYQIRHKRAQSPIHTVTF